MTIQTRSSSIGCGSDPGVTSGWQTNSFNTLFLRHGNSQGHSAVFERTSRIYRFILCQNLNAVHFINFY